MAFDYDAADTNATPTISEITSMKDCVNSSILNSFELFYDQKCANRNRHFNLPDRG